MELCHIGQDLRSDRSLMFYWIWEEGNIGPYTGIRWWVSAIGTLLGYTLSWPVSCTLL